MCLVSRALSHESAPLLCFNFRLNINTVYYWRDLVYTPSSVCVWVRITHYMRECDAASYFAFRAKVVFGGV